MFNVKMIMLVIIYLPSNTRTFHSLCGFLGFLLHWRYCHSHCELKAVKLTVKVVADLFLYFCGVHSAQHAVIGDRQNQKSFHFITTRLNFFSSCFSYYSSIKHFQKLPSVHILVETFNVECIIIKALFYWWWWLGYMYWSGDVWQ